MTRRRPIVVLLAGGRARRIGGGDKCLRALGGHTLLEHVVARMRPQAEALILNANGDPSRFDRYGLTVVPDMAPDNPGPLVGIASGMAWVASVRPDVADVVSVPTDCPFLPADLIDRLLAARAASGARAAVAASGGRTHPVVGLWPVALAQSLLQAVKGEGLRRAGEWSERQHSAVATYPEADGVDPFFNVNTAADLRLAERMLRD